MDIDQSSKTVLHEAAGSPYLVPDDGSFKVETAGTRPPEGVGDNRKCKKRLKTLIKKLDRLQRLFYANDRFSLLLIFQAMDAAGKDGTIRAVMNVAFPKP